MIAARKLRNTALRDGRLRELYEAHLDFVWRSARRFGASRACLDDVVQEVFLAAHRGMQGRRSASVKAWLYGITRNVVRMHLRKEGRYRRRVDAVRTLGVATEGPSHGRRHEAADLLGRLLEGLSRPLREAYVLVELEGMTALEVAEACGINPNTAQSRVRRARIVLHEKLRELDERGEATR
ncbi:MAG: RNA polymerase sigma factor [Myxococcales bacterium]|nr:RNA polymerase sigma factor [Myxococcales bacterium]MCB9715710.1 RNA polymerase sigma factor [Myxococcales bacterium]